MLKQLYLTIFFIIDPGISYYVTSAYNVQSNAYGAKLQNLKKKKKISHKFMRMHECSFF